MKACPFCGGKAMKYNFAAQGERVGCSPTGDGRCPHEGVWLKEETWDTRPAEDALAAESAALLARAEAAEFSMAAATKEISRLSRELGLAEGRLDMVTKAAKAAKDHLDKFICGGCPRSCVVQCAELLLQEKLAAALGEEEVTK